MKKKRFLWYLGGLVALVFGIVLDQWTKFLATTYLKGKEDIVLIKNVFCLHYLENRGAAFGIFKDRNIFYYYHLAVTFRSTLLFISDCRIQSVLLRFASARFLWRLVESEI